ncbi:MAG: ABC transporter substrate-binding protein [Ruminococcus sp.]|nr:ABC transporter substrate-binding protein [Ruminococcus sp.]MDE6784533.1 ABC transporter substrate-binding protein [Ruminococcus sp.]
MNNLRKLLACISAAAVTAAFSCSEKESLSENSEISGQSEEISVPVFYEENLSEESLSEEIPEAEIKIPNIRGQHITWLADYDLNPQDNQEKSIALSLFEDIYGAYVNFIYVNSDEKFSRLESMILSGDDVDMFPYEPNALPDGVLKNQYEPLDPYFDIIGIDTELWDGMRDTVDMFEYNGNHYVVPYTVSNPILITYSRKLMKSEKLDDPYKLYIDGKWDWDAMMKMMEKFVSKAESGQTRYGINGVFGEAVIRSTGHTVVNYEDGKFRNNIKDSELEKAGKFMKDIVSKNLYNSYWYDCYPSSNSVLFYAMGDWSLGKSNAQNPDGDLMAVPFPKAPDAEQNYLCCDFSAKMLVKGSWKGEAVAAYIRCERLAASQEDYRELAKQKALSVKKSDSGRPFVTEEQYDAIQSYIESENISPVFDFGCGMGESMYGDGNYTYDTRGVMNNLSEAILNGNADSWKSLCERWTETIDEAVKQFNKE